MSVTAGQVLSHYRLLSPLGAGWMGEVWLAEDTTLKRGVAIKLLPAAVATDPDRLARFQREAEAIAALNHPNIVTIYSVERDGDVRFLTMELVEGQSLDKRIPRGGLPLARVLEIGATLADALAASHEKGIIHRDLKPANVMLAGRERAPRIGSSEARFLVGGYRTREHDWRRRTAAPLPRLDRVSGGCLGFTTVPTRIRVRVDQATDGYGSSRFLGPLSRRPLRRIRRHTWKRGGSGCPRKRPAAPGCDRERRGDCPPRSRPTPLAASASRQMGVSSTSTCCAVYATDSLDTRSLPRLRGDVVGRRCRRSRSGVLSAGRF
jgi:hypothetical protein